MKPVALLLLKMINDVTLKIDEGDEKISGFIWKNHILTLKSYLI